MIQTDDKLCTFIYFTLHLDVSIVRADYLSGHGKAYSHTVVGRIACFIESFEYMREMLFLNSFSVILYNNGCTQIILSS